MPQPPALALVSELASITGRPVDDAQLAAAVRDASRRFRGAVGHGVTYQKGDSVVLRGRGARILLLPWFPIVEGDDDPFTVRLDGVEFDRSRYRVAPGEGMVESLAGVWPLGLGSIEVTCSHGYDATVTAAAGDNPEYLGGIPEDIQGAVLSMAQLILNVLPGVQARTVLGDTVAFFSNVGATEEWSDAVSNHKLRGGV